MQQQIYYNIFKLFLTKEYYDKFSKYIDRRFLQESLPELYRIFVSFETMCSDGSVGNNDVTTLATIFYTLYPNSKKEIFDPLFTSIQSAEGSPEAAISYLETARKAALSTRLSLVCVRQANGEDVADEYKALTQELSEPLRVTENDYDFVSDDLEVLYNARRMDTGLRWRLDSLNKSLGPLRSGDFGFLSARPETGKTTFLASEISFMAEQTGRPILWFNNEEQGSKVMIRVYQAYFGITLPVLYSDVARYKRSFSDTMGGRIRIYDRAIIRRMEVESICTAINPSAVIFDQIDKIQGFQADRPDLEHKLRYQWAREIAKTYACPVIGVCQAGATAENKKWLTMNDIDSSKTAKQGEADWILGIGAVHDEGKESIRYFSLPKNKLDGDENTLPERRHGKWITQILPEIARYNDE
jgi:replicative DNA helicase